MDTQIGRGIRYNTTSILKSCDLALSSTLSSGDDSTSVA